LTPFDTSAARILIVDDQAANVRLLEMILETNGWMNYRSITDSLTTFDLCQEYQPDLILLDLHMPRLDGFGVLEGLQAHIARQGYLPVLVLTADVTPAAKQRALRMGAKDFLAKPVDAIEVGLRVKNLLETRLLYARLQGYNEELEQRVRERTRQLAKAQTEVLRRLAIAAEYRDDDTGHHTQRVGNLAALLGRALGQSDDEIALLRLAAGLHDVGKIGIPDRILLKPGKYEPAEFEIMKSHAAIGSEILGRSQFPVLQLAHLIALSHHERWDGSGYPQGLKGDQIPLAARIVAIADVFDALTHERPYKKAWPLEDAIAEIRQQSGRQFDPDLIERFLGVLGSEGLLNLATQIEREAEHGDLYLTEFESALCNPTNG
jgi:putative two-component system response regulator